MNIPDLKAALLEAVDRKAVVLAQASAVNLDIKFRTDGSVVSVVMFPKYEFTVRGRLPIGDYEFKSECLIPDT
jgi:hypothetical protein